MDFPGPWGITWVFAELFKEAFVTVGEDMDQSGVEEDWRVFPWGIDRIFSEYEANQFPVYGIIFRHLGL